MKISCITLGTRIVKAYNVADIPLGTINNILRQAGLK